MDFDVLIEPSQGAPASDLDGMQHWIRLLERRSVETGRIVLLEVEARLRRMASTDRGVLWISWANAESSPRPVSTPRSAAASC